MGEHDKEEKEPKGTETQPEEPTTEEPGGGAGHDPESANEDEGGAGHDPE